MGSTGNELEQPEEARWSEYFWAWEMCGTLERQEIFKRASPSAGNVWNDRTLGTPTFGKASISSRGKCMERWNALSGGGFDISHPS